MVCTAAGFHADQARAQVGEVLRHIRTLQLLKIQESADELTEVNQLLKHEVDERIALERELLAAQTALAKAKAELAKK